MKQQEDVIIKQLKDCMRNEQMLVGYYLSSELGFKVPLWQL